MRTITLTLPLHEAEALAAAGAYADRSGLGIGETPYDRECLHKAIAAMRKAIDGDWRDDPMFHRVPPMGDGTSIVTGQPRK